MPRSRIRRIERIEHYLVRIIQQKGADQGHPWPVRFLLGLLKGLACIFAGVVTLHGVTEGDHCVAQGLGPKDLQNGH